MRKRLPDKQVIKRSVKKQIGIFVDGPSLDRATRRLKKRIDFAALLKGLSEGLTPIVIRYYTILPYEDDSRHHAFLDAVEHAGFSVVVKRLPPKGVERQVTIDVEMATDIMAFALGQNVLPVGSLEGGQMAPFEKTVAETNETKPTMRSVTIVCPSREITYPLSLLKEYGVDSVSVDFSELTKKNALKSASKFMDLSGSTTIWKE